MRSEPWRAATGTPIDQSSSQGEGADHCTGNQTMSNTPSLQTDAPASPEIVRRMLRGAWLGVWLGLSIEVLLLLLQLLQGVLPDTVRIIADTVQKISWSSLVCATLAAGQGAARGKLAAAGIVGLVGAPIAFLLARSLHKAMMEILGQATATPVPWLAAGIKGVEYALLGAAILWLAKRKADWKSHAFTGAAVGGITYYLVLWLLPAGGDPLQRAIIEVVHPIGCALAVHASASFNKHLGGSSAD
jgi:hypothetical protein